MINRVILIGRITADPVLRTSKNDKNYVGFTLAVNNTRSNNNITNYINCFAWEKNAENMHKYVTKGLLLAVEGALRSRKITDANGNNRSELLVDAISVIFLEKKKNESETSTPVKKTPKPEEKEDGEINWN